jgi:hypothetical protein
MLKAHDRMQKASEYMEHRQVPIRDAEGRDHSISVRDVTPRNLAEAITNRLTRPAEQQFDPSDVKGLAREQFERSQREHERMAQYLQVRREIAAEYCTIAGVRENQIAPVVSAEQLQQIRDEVSKLPGYHAHQREFEREIKMAEQGLSERERERERGRAGDNKLGPDQDPERGQSRERPMTVHDQREIDRYFPAPDRDSSFRGR